MIDIKKLTESDKGRWVRYISSIGFYIYIGRIKGWDNEFIYVVYNAPDRDMNKYNDYVAVPTDPQKLIFEDIWQSN